MHVKSISGYSLITAFNIMLCTYFNSINISFQTKSRPLNINLKSFLNVLSYYHQNMETHLSVLASCTITNLYKQTNSNFKH